MSGFGLLPQEPKETKDVRQLVRELEAMRSKLSDEVATLKAEASKWSAAAHQAKTSANLTIQKSAEASEAILAHAQKLERDAQKEVERQQILANETASDLERIKEIRKDLESRRRALDKQRESLENQLAGTVTREAAVDARTVKLDAQEAGFVERENHVAALSRTVNDKDVALRAKEQDLIRREGALAENLRVYDRKEQITLDERKRLELAIDQFKKDSTALNLLNAEVDDKQKKLLILDDDLKRQQKALTVRNNRLNEYSLTLDLKERQLRRVAKMHGFEQKLDELMKQEAPE